MDLPVVGDTRGVFSAHIEATHVARQLSLGIQAVVSASACGFDRAAEVELWSVIPGHGGSGDVQA
jgi:hypothetical protein